jgi:hypothetical protein
MRVVFALMILVAYLASFRKSEDRNDAVTAIKKPNIILILADQWRAQSRQDGKPGGSFQECHFCDACLYTLQGCTHDWKVPHYYRHDLQ